MNEMQAPEGAPREAVGEVKKDYTKWIIGGVVAVVLLYGAQYMFSPQRAIE